MTHRLCLKLSYRTYFQLFRQNDGTYRQNFTIIHSVQPTHTWNFLRLLISLAKTNFFSLWILHLFFVSFAILSLKHFFDQHTVKEPSSETLLRSAKLVLIKAFSWSCQIFFQFPYRFTSHEWLRENLSLQYQYNIKHRSDENKVKYQLGDY